MSGDQTIGRCPYCNGPLTNGHVCCPRPMTVAPFHMLTTADLINDLKSRINPLYAWQLGTESYERRLCVESLETQVAEIDRLRAEVEALRGAVLAEREACAKVCEAYGDRVLDDSGLTDSCAAAIRARGES